jgi:hypothetical protein
MTTEKDQDILPEDQDIDPPQESEIEGKAREQGWRPEEEWEGPAEQWIPADEFMRRAPLFDAIKKANKDNKQLRKMVSSLAEHNAKVEKAAYDRAKSELVATKQAALKEENIVQYAQADAELQELEGNKPVDKSGSVEQEILNTWVENNSWYTEDEDKQVYADGYATKLRNKYPNMDLEELLDEVSQRVEEKFKPKPSRKVSSPPIRNGGKGVGNKMTYADLPNEAKQMHDTFVKSDSNPHGFMTSEEYIRQYALQEEQGRR